MAVIGGDAFGVKLDSVYGVVLVLQAHDDAVFGFGGDIQRIRQAVPFHNQGMVARGRERGRQVFEHAFSCVQDVGDFAVHGRGCADDPAAENLADALMAETDAEKRDVAVGAGLDKGGADAAVVRIAGAGGNHDAGRAFGQDIPDADLIVSVDAHILPQVAQILDEVVGEAVIIVDQGDAHGFVYDAGMDGRQGDW